MKYLLDSNICIFVLRKKPLQVLQKLVGFPSAEIVVSSVSVGELYYGTHRSADPAKNRAALDQFLSPFQVLDFDSSAALACGDLRARLEFAGTPIGSLDTLIAAQALTTGLTLVTNNVREFARVPGLVIEDWT